MLWFLKAAFPSLRKEAGGGAASAAHEGGEGVRAPFCDVFEMTTTPLVHPSADSLISRREHPILNPFPPPLAIHTRLQPGLPPCPFIPRWVGGSGEHPEDRGVHPL